MFCPFTFLKEVYTFRPVPGGRDRKSSNNFSRESSKIFGYRSGVARLHHTILKTPVVIPLCKGKKNGLGVESIEHLNANAEDKFEHIAT